MSMIHCGHGCFRRCWPLTPLCDKTIHLPFRFSELVWISVSFQPPSNRAEIIKVGRNVPNYYYTKKQKRTNKEIKSPSLSVFLGL